MAEGKRGPVARCQVLNCKDVPEAYGPRYYRRFKICKYHSSLPELVMVSGRRVRFCQLCGRFEEIVNFDGDKKSCRASLEKHNKRRRRARQQRKADAMPSCPPSPSEGCSLGDSSATARIATSTTRGAALAWVPQPVPSNGLHVPQHHHQQQHQPPGASNKAVAMGNPQLPFPNLRGPGQLSQQHTQQPPQQLLQEQPGSPTLPAAGAAWQLPFPNLRRPGQLSKQQQQQQGPQQQQQQQPPTGRSTVAAAMAARQLPFPKPGGVSQQQQQQQQKQKQQGQGLQQQQQRQGQGEALGPPWGLQQAGEQAAGITKQQSLPDLGLIIGEGPLIEGAGPGQGTGCAVIPEQPTQAPPPLPPLPPHRSMQLQKLLGLQLLQLDSDSLFVAGLVRNQGAGSESPEGPAPFPAAATQRSSAQGSQDWEGPLLSVPIPVPMPVEPTGQEMVLLPGMLPPCPFQPLKQPARLPQPPSGAAEAEPRGTVPVGRCATGSGAAQQPVGPMGAAPYMPGEGPSVAMAGAGAASVPGPAPIAGPGATEQQFRRPALALELLPALQAQQRAFQEDLKCVSLHLFGVVPELLAPQVKEGVVKLMAADPDFAAQVIRRSSMGTSLGPSQGP